MAKTSMRQGTNLARTIAEMEEDVNAHMMARQYANDFNKALAKTGLATQTVTYHPVNLVLLEAGRSAPGPQTAMFLEPFLTGRCVPIYLVQHLASYGIPVRTTNVGLTS